MKETWREGVYFRIEGDSRLYTDIPMLESLRRMIPDVAHDVCPYCGSSAAITQCRCPLSHRTCFNCEAGRKGWHYDIDKKKAAIVLIKDK